MNCFLGELNRQSKSVFENFERIEPRTWTPSILAIELCGEVGSLTHAILDLEGYKRRSGSVAKLKDECSDVLFILIRICRSLHIPLPNSYEFVSTHGMADGSVEQHALGISSLAGKLTEIINGEDRPKQLDMVLAMVELLGLIAEHYRFSLEEAYLAELNLCRLWQKRTLASLHSRQWIKRWFGAR